jgi:hypothetical protein
MTGAGSSRAVADRQREHLAAQPWLGVGGLLLGAVVFFALALGLGSTEASLLVLGPLATFALPAVAMIAFWWNDWPGSQLTAPWTGLIDTVLVVGGAVALTIAGQATVERSDLRDSQLILRGGQRGLRRYRPVADTERQLCW